MADDKRTKAELIAELERLRGERDRLADRYRKLADAHDRVVVRVDALESALQRTVEYVGTSILPVEPGWSWYDTLSGEDWFDDWIAELPDNPLPRLSVEALRAMLGEWRNGTLTADHTRLLDQYLNPPQRVAIDSADDVDDLRAALRDTAIAAGAALFEREHPDLAARINDQLQR